MGFGAAREGFVVHSDDYDMDGIVTGKNGKFYLRFRYHGKDYEQDLCPIKEEASMFIHSIALWSLEKYLADIEMEEAYALCIKEEG